jgi:hypothetical protein
LAPVTKATQFFICMIDLINYFWSAKPRVSKG